jgi:hypothetical protein
MKEGNFNALMEILGGLNLHPILRLRKTWEVCFALHAQSP